MKDYNVAAGVQVGISVTQVGISVASLYIVRVVIKIQ
jgi:hypothetical protein